VRVTHVLVTFGVICTSPAFGTITTGPDPVGVGGVVAGAVPKVGNVVPVVGAVPPKVGNDVPVVVGAGVPPLNEGNVVAVGVGAGVVGAGVGVVLPPNEGNVVVAPPPNEGNDVYDVYDGEESYQTPPKIPNVVVVPLL